jgi:cytochrome c-type biogenesis protein CcmH/NrfG
VSVRAGESRPLVSLAETLRREGDFRLAEDAYAVAAEADPRDPSILWDRAENLRRLGKEDDARALMRRIADGDWPDWHRGIADRARWMLEKK